ncbi:hypothetical protein Aduo_009722 [Ancylostoma duodenale]
MSVVDRSFCANRCFDRGLCIMLDDLFYCICDDESGDCTGRTSTPLTTSTTMAAELSSEDLWILAIVGVVILVVFAILFWWCVRCCKRVYRCCCGGSGEPVVDVRVSGGNVRRKESSV